MSQEVSKDFKRLMRIVPNINQKDIDNSVIDDYESAHDAISSFNLDNDLEESIWYSARGDNKFKIRLRSKQSGRAIDLNLRFILNENETFRT